MAETGLQSDKGIGLGLLFGALGVAGAVVMYVAAEQQLLAGWGFALAVVFGSLAVAAVQIFS
jgi:hypothetical protein